MGSFWEQMGQGEQVGRGTEKRVTIDPKHPERVVAQFTEGHETSSERRIKARGYLTKIVHLLFPKNTPALQIAARSEGNDFLVMEKKKLDDQHVRLQELGEEIRSPNPDTFASVVQEKNALHTAMKERLQADDRYHNLVRDMRNAGVGNIEINESNFGYDDSGNIIYVDNSFSAWQIMNNNGNLEIAWHFDFERLQDAIQKLEAGDKEHAEHYLNRIQELANEELKEKQKMLERKSA